MLAKNVLIVSKILAYVVTVLVLVALGALLYQKYVSYRLRRKLKKRFNHARDGEFSAETLLKKHGYQLSVAQKSARLSMWVNGEHHTYLVRPDAFAHKDGKRYIVEVKTGSVASDPKKSATRRQLLEYYHGFDVDGLLLVDAEKQEVNDIYFESHAMKAGEVVEKIIVSKKAMVVAFIGGAVLSVLIVIFRNRG